MKIIKKDIGINLYDNIKLDLRVIKEEGDNLNEIYDAGFLPISTQDKENEFFRTRSYRVLVDKFSFSSENKRISKKFEDKFKRGTLKIEEFNNFYKKGIASENIQHFDELFKSYFLRTHNKDIKTNIKNIIKQNIINEVSYYKRDGVIEGYVILIKNKNMKHLWLTCFSEKMEKKGFGVFLLLKETLIAKEEGRKYFYLGTCYGFGGRYKLNFTPAEFFDKDKWNDNLKDLKSKLKSDY